MQNVASEWLFPRAFIFIASEPSEQYALVKLRSSSNSVDTWYDKNIILFIQFFSLLFNVIVISRNPVLRWAAWELVWRHALSSFLSQD